MFVEKDRKVALSYVLTVDGKEVDRAESLNPLEFIFGYGNLLPQFEANIAGLGEGDDFSFELAPEDGYGVYIEQNVVAIPKDIFVIEGEVQEDLLRIGAAVPMQMRGGGTMVGRVKAVDGDRVTMDFNHELAGKTLHFVGRVEHIESVSEAELAEMLASHHCCDGHGGCGDGGCGCDGHGHDHDCGCC